MNHSIIHYTYYGISYYPIEIDINPDIPQNQKQRILKRCFLGTYLEINVSEMLRDGSPSFPARSF